MGVSLSREHVIGALRKIRPSVYQVDDSATGPTIMLRMAVSPSGRRNASAQIVAALGERGLELATKDPVAELAVAGNRIRVNATGRADE